MGKTLYVEGLSGISGDMTVAALLDLGADKEVLLNVLKSLPVSGYEIAISRVKKSGIDACDFNVILEKDNHDHDMAYLHGHDHHHEDEHGHHHDGEHEHHHHEHEYCHEHDHHDEYEHDHCHDGEHEHHHHEHHHDENDAYMSEHRHEDTDEHIHHSHDEAHMHTHSHDDEHTHEHATLPGILHLIGHAQMSDRAKAIATRIFEIVAEAEAKAHGVSLNEVHFHEVGAVDSIVDVVSVAVCLDNLDVTEVIVPRLCEGHGTVRCQHGIMPIPVPAVANIVQAHHLKLQITEVEGELVTPTGAAIVAAIKTSEKMPAQFEIEKTGIGAGKREYSRPSMLRLMLIKDTSKETTGSNCNPESLINDLHNTELRNTKSQIFEENLSNAKVESCNDSLHNTSTQTSDEIQILETNIDDCSGECMGYLMNRLLEAGARDAHYSPVFMKKNRPGYLLRVICDMENVSALEQIIFEETTTIGIRRIEAKRTILPRKKAEIDTPIGKAQVKICTLPDGQVRYYPEYESAAALAKEHGISLYEAMQMIKNAAE